MSKDTSALIIGEGRILDIPCKVCGDFSSGKHYNIFACDGCAGFFKRSIRRNRQYVCKAKEEGSCVIDKTHRNQCRACRLQKCQEAGMNKDAVQHERGPRNSTLRRQQMSNFFNEARERMMPSPPVSALNLAMPKPSTPPVFEGPFGFIAPAGFLCNTLVSFPRFPFPLRPISPPTVTNSSVVCEAAARLLFMNIQWTRTLPSFTSLSLSDQLLLLEESWRELFVLGASQFLPLTYLPHLIPPSFETSTNFLQRVQEFQDILVNIRQFQIDPQEYSCLKATILFKTNFDKPCTKLLNEPSKIAAIQDETQLTLNKYITSTHPGQPLRFGKLLLLLPTLKKVTGETIEELFFRKSIGNIPIQRILSDMYKSQTNM
ncbi:nuclear receptor subfamily 2 group E member 1 isoform X1 [Diorhabda carinulata]|uniref:nuclear receptor subfamily 2 group E member 1 isoform X1 n=1 Tax=Diorhabda carinulata TaxID=1163345 RepID=UPI0025A1E42E|nr:nuclear receptor subfamily 2 group E member 1 isoform X1 [Diorhabda carinulata]